MTQETRETSGVKLASFFAFLALPILSNQAFYHKIHNTNRLQAPFLPQPFPMLVRHPWRGPAQNSQPFFIGTRDSDPYGIVGTLNINSS